VGVQPVRVEELRAEKLGEILPTVVLPDPDTPMTTIEWIVTSGGLFGVTTELRAHRESTRAAKSPSSRDS